MRRLTCWVPLVAASALALISACSSADDGSAGASDVLDPGATPGAGSTDSGGGGAGQTPRDDAGRDAPSSPVNLSTQATAGTRLRPRIAKAADGTRVFLGFRDTLRNEDCTVQYVATEKALRCIPHRCAGTVTPSAHVRFQREPGAIVEALGAVELVGEDGSRAFDTLKDEQKGVHCEPAKASDSVTRCVPLRGQPRLTGHVYHSDAACANEMASRPTVVDESNTLAYAVRTMRIASSCDVYYDVHALGPEGPNQACFYKGPGPACTAVNVEQCNGYRPIAGQVVASSFIAMPEAAAGAARLRPRLHAAGAGRVVQAGLVDSVKAVACQVGAAADGSLRCLPAMRTETLFTDVACTKPAATSPPCAPFLAYDDESTCPPRRRVFAAGATGSGPLYWRPSVGDACVRYTVGGPNQTFDYTASGAELAPSELESLTLE